MVVKVSANRDKSPYAMERKQPSVSTVLVLKFRTMCATLRLVAKWTLAMPNGDIFWTTTV